MTGSSNPFDDPHRVARYAETASRMVPGYQGLLRMAAVLMPPEPDWDTLHEAGFTDITEFLSTFTFAGGCATRDLSALGCG